MKVASKIIIGIVAIAAVIGLIVWKTRGSQTTYETAAVDKGTVIEEVSVTGSLAPMSRIELQPEVNGRIVKIAVKAGDEVKEGDLLIKLDSRDIDARAAAQEASVAGARAQLDALVSGATPEDLRVSQTAVDTARAQYDAAVSAKGDAERALVNAQRNLENSRAKAETYLSSKVMTFANDYDSAADAASDAVSRLTDPLFNDSGFLSFGSSDSQAEANAISSRREALSAVDRLIAMSARVKIAPTSASLIAEYDAVVADMRAVKRHADACAAVLNYAIGVSSTTLSAWQTNVSAAQSGVSASLDQISSDRNGLDLQERMNTTDITAAEIGVTSANAALNAATKAIGTAEKSVAQAEALYDLKKTGARSQDVDAQRARLRAELAALDGLYAEAAKRRIVAPLAAVVTDLPIEPGESVTPGRTVVTLNARGNFEIMANISEIDIAKVKVGNAVSITLDAFPDDEKWTGKVARVMPAEKVVEGVIFYETKIVFDQEDPRIKSGMTANLDIEIGRVNDVVRLPIRALLQSPGRRYVQVLVDGKVQEHEVVVGLENNEHVEIKSGVSVGDLVVVATTKK